MTVVAGNPKPDSRTLDAARRVAHTLTGTEPDQGVDIVGLRPALLGWGDEAVTRAVRAVQQSRFVVIASPTFKATYSGVLKLFLDHFDTGHGLEDVVVPLMLGAGPAHTMAPDLLLKPVLVELGAIAPAPGLYLLNDSDTTDSRIDTYTRRWGPTPLAATTSRTERS